MAVVKRGAVGTVLFFKVFPAFCFCFCFLHVFKLCVLANGNFHWNCYLIEILFITLYDLFYFSLFEIIINSVTYLSDTSVIRTYRTVFTLAGTSAPIIAPYTIIGILCTARTGFEWWTNWPRVICNENLLLGYVVFDHRFKMQSTMLMMKLKWKNENKLTIIMFWTILHISHLKVFYNFGVFHHLSILLQQTALWPCPHTLYPFTCW